MPDPAATAKAECVTGDLYAGGGVKGTEEGDSFTIRNVRFGGVCGRGSGAIFDDSAGDCDRASEETWLDSDGAWEVSSFLLLMYTYWASGWPDSKEESEYWERDCEGCRTGGEDPCGREGSGIRGEGCLRCEEAMEAVSDIWRSDVDRG